MNADPRLIRVAVGRPPDGPTFPHPNAQAHAHAHGHAAQPTPPAGHAPLIDIHEGPAGLVLEADLPGATEDGVTIQLEENVLTLQARIEPPIPPGARLLHEEYRVAPFHRSFILSDEVERSQITAELKHGVLRVVLPKAERARTRRIEIKPS